MELSQNLLNYLVRFIHYTQYVLVRYSFSDFFMSKFYSEEFWVSPKKYSISNNCYWITRISYHFDFYILKVRIISSSGEGSVYLIDGNVCKSFGNSCRWSGDGGYIHICSDTSLFHIIRDHQHSY